MAEESKKVKLYSYSKVWKLEKKVYSIQNVVLPVPVNPYMLLSFILIAGGVFFLGKMIPIMAGLPVVIKYLAIPLFLSNYLMKKKLDGMNPLKYFVGIVIYMLRDRNMYLEGFSEYANKESKVVLDWNCSKGHR